MFTLPTMLTTPSNSQSPIEPSRVIPANATKITRGHSCVLCQQRKVKCDRQKPCSNCLKARADCIVATPNQPRRRRRNATESDLIARIKRLESMLKSHNISLDMDPEESNSLHFRSRSPGDDHIGVNNMSRLTMNPPHSARDEPGAFFFGRTHAHFVENALWDNLKEEMLDQPDTSSDDELQESSEIQLPPGDFLLMGIGEVTDIFHLHPSVAHIFRLWQVFLDNCNPLVKTFHAPTVQQMIIDASGDMTSLTKPNEALLFSIYFLAVVSLTNEECENHFGQPRHYLLTKYIRGVQQALVNAKFLRSLNLTTLQAFVLYMTGGRRIYDPHTVYTMSGVVVRIAQRLGIHTDLGTSKLFTPFEGEMRRRTWWQIVFLDGHASKLAGVQFPAWLAKFDTKLPININDSELYPTMKELPASKEGITEMVFCAMRYETVHILRSAGTLHNPNADGTWPVTSIPDVIEAKEKAIAELEIIYERKFTRYCDPGIPLQLLMIYMAKSVLLTMRIMAHHPRQYPDKGASMSQKEKDLLFDMCLTELEIDNTGHKNDLISRFIWHVHVYFQVDAFIYVLSELRNRSTGHNVDKAWEHLQLAYTYRPELIEDTKNSLFFAIGTLTLKSWDVRENALGYLAEIPLFITQLRAQRHTASNKEFGKQQGSSSTHINTFKTPYTNEPLAQLIAVPAEVIRSTNTAPVLTNMDITYADALPGITPIDWEYWQTLMEGDLPNFDGGLNGEDWT